MARKFSNGIDLQSQRAVNAADASNPTDLVTKQQLDAAVAGLSWKQPVRVATTTNGTLTTAFAAGQTIDGVTLATSDRILIKDQSTASQNGIYVVQSSGSPVRATDADSTAELQAATVYVTSGTTNADKAYTQTTDSPTVGSSHRRERPHAHRLHARRRRRHGHQRRHRHRRHRHLRSPPQVLDLDPWRYHVDRHHP
jgi:hypothetical protein